MPAGIQIFFADGTLSFDMTNSITKILGFITIIGTYNAPGNNTGSISVPEFASGKGFCYLADPGQVTADGVPINMGRVTFTITSTGFSYSVSPAGGASGTYVLTIYYGIY